MSARVIPQKSTRRRRARSRAWMAALLVIAAATLASEGCVVAGGGTSGRQIDCSGLTCDWVTVEGTPTFGDTWHQGDHGLDLSGEGRVVVEQRVVLIPPFNRQLTLQASVVRDPNVSIHIECAFFAPGQAPGATFWDRAPVPLAKRENDVFELGVFRLRRDVLVPSEGAAMILRITKEGSGHAIIDELTFG